MKIKNAIRMPSSADNVIPGAQRLWFNVLRQALDDAIPSLHKKHAAERVIITEAREFLLKPNPDFDLVCDLADVEASQMRALARKLIEGAQAKHDEKATAGVVKNFGQGLGTGGGSAPQDRAEIEFSHDTEPQPCP